MNESQIAVIEADLSRPDHQEATVHLLNSKNHYREGSPRGPRILVKAECIKLQVPEQADEKRVDDQAQH